MQLMSSCILYVRLSPAARVMIAPLRSTSSVAESKSQIACSSLGLAFKVTKELLKTPFEATQHALSRRLEPHRVASDPSGCVVSADHVAAPAGARVGSWAEVGLSSVPARFGPGHKGILLISSYF